MNSRLNKEKQRILNEIARSEGMLSNARFLEKAPAQKVQEEKDKLAENQQRLKQVEERIASL